MTINGKYFLIDVSINDENQRIDAYIVRYFVENDYVVTRNIIQNSLSYIRVNNKNVKKNYSIKAGDKIEIYIPEPVINDIKPEDINIPIIYEDDDIIVVNKPHGLVVHPAKTHNSGTLVHGLANRLNLSINIGGQLRPGIVHRLDKDTSGVMVVAKSEIAYNVLCKLFSERKIKKEYHAIVKGFLRDQKIELNAPIKRHYKFRKRFMVSENGKDAITHFTVKKEFEKNSLVVAKPITGRTHQIRVHLAYLRCPILGDPIYSKRNSESTNLKLMLVAKKIEFNHPVTGNNMKFEIDYPEHFQNCLEILGEY